MGTHGFSPDVGNTPVMEAPYVGSRARAGRAVGEGRKDTGQRTSERHRSTDVGKPPPVNGRRKDTAGQRTSERHRGPVPGGGSTGYGRFLWRRGGREVDETFDRSCSMRTVLPPGRFTGSDTTTCYLLRGRGSLRAVARPEETILNCSQKIYKYTRTTCTKKYIPARIFVKGDSSGDWKNSRHNSSRSVRKTS